jgi:hypothetical protein
LNSLKGFRTFSFGANYSLNCATAYSRKGRLPGAATHIIMTQRITTLSVVIHKIGAVSLMTSSFMILIIITPSKMQLSIVTLINLASNQMTPKMALRKMTFRKMTFRKMTFRKMTFRKMTFRKMAFRKMTLRKMTLRKMKLNITLLITMALCMTIFSIRRSV